MTELDQLVQEAVHAPFSGWDFSWLAGRATEIQPPWSYDAEIDHALTDGATVLDIDTGGGEVLSRHLPAGATVVATEGYPPNIPIAAARLMPLGASVVGTGSAPDNVDQVATDPHRSSSHLPFRDESFDAVLDRHSSYWPREVMRVLRPGGTFATQQRGIGGGALCALFEIAASPGPAFDRDFAVAQLRSAGAEVVRAETATMPIVFHDVGAFVYLMRAAPWVLPGCDVAAHRSALERIDTVIRREGSFEVDGGHMLLIACRPA